MLDILIVFLNAVHVLKVLTIVGRGEMCTKGGNEPGRCTVGVCK